MPRVAWRAFCLTLRAARISGDPPQAVVGRALTAAVVIASIATTANANRVYRLRVSCAVLIGFAAGPVTPNRAGGEMFVALA